MREIAFRRFNRQPILHRSGSMWEGFALQRDTVDSCPTCHRNISGIRFAIAHYRDGQARLTGLIITITRSSAAQIPIACSLP
jgi:hypothetical protein